MQPFDTSLFEVRKGVPLVDSFQLTRDGIGYTVDDKYLDDVVTNYNRRVSETGDLPVIKETHKGEEVLGFCRALRKQPLGNSGRNAIFGDMYVYRKHADMFQTHPRRSAELNYGPRELDAVAMLGTTPPERSLGLSLSRDSQTKLHLSCPDMNDTTIAPPPTNDGMPKWMADVMAGLQQLLPLLNEVKSALSTPAPTQPQIPGADPTSQGSPEMNDADLDALIAELEKEDGGDGEQPEAKPDEDDKKKEKEDKVSLERIAKLEAQLAERNLRDQLLTLQRDGYKIDVEDEVKFAMSLDPETRTLHLSRVTKNYPKAPVGNKPLDGLDDAAALEAPKTYDKVKVRETLSLARAEGKPLTWEQAYFKVHGTSPNAAFAKEIK